MNLNKTQLINILTLRKIQADASMKKYHLMALYNQCYNNTIITSDFSDTLDDTRDKYDISCDNDTNTRDKYDISCDNDTNTSDKYDNACDNDTNTRDNNPIACDNDTSDKSRDTCDNSDILGDADIIHDVLDGIVGKVLNAQTMETYTIPYELESIELYPSYDWDEYCL